jgi:hypothetical protein
MPFLRRGCDAQNQSNGETGPLEIRDSDAMNADAQLYASFFGDRRMYAVVVYKEPVVDAEL